MTLILLFSMFTAAPQPKPVEVPKYYRSLRKPAY